MELECDFTELNGHLDKNMAMAISTYSLDTGYNDLALQCSDVCNSGSTKIYNVEWHEGIEHDEPEPSEDDEEDADDEEEEDRGEDTRVLVWGEAAPSLTAG